MPRGSGTVEAFDLFSRPSGVSPLALQPVPARPAPQRIAAAPELLPGLPLPWEEGPRNRLPDVDLHIRRRYEQDRREAAYLRLAEERGWIFWGERFEARVVAWLQPLAPTVPLDHLHVFSTSRSGSGAWSAQFPAGELALLSEPYWQGPGVMHADLVARADVCCAPLMARGWRYELISGRGTVYWPGWTVMLLLFPPYRRLPHGTDASASRRRA